MKTEIRKQMNQLRLQLSNEEFNNYSEQVIEKVVTYLKDNNFNNILIYMDMNKEVPVTRLINYNFNFFITKTTKELSLLINKYNKDELVLHPYGFYESSSTDYINPTLIEAAIIPGLAFDQNGNRLGYGKGYYDRFLANNPHIKRIAVCFDFQLIDFLPTNKYDQMMDIIITEKRILEFKR